MASSANLEVMQLQEESFHKMKNEISQLQGKIKGLENKLVPSSNKKPLKNPS